MASTEVVVGRMGRPHGVHGEVSVELRTDEPDRRFADGTLFTVRGPDGVSAVGGGRPTGLTVRRTRWHQSRLLVSFEEVTGRTEAEALRGLTLAVEVDATETPQDADEFYDHQLVGLCVATTTGTDVGLVLEVQHGAGQDLLVVHTHEGREVLVPFVTALVPVVDVAGGRLEVADRPGLLTPLDGPGQG